MTGVTCVPGPGRMLAAAQTLVTWLGKRSFVVEPRKTFVDPKDLTDMNNEAAEMGKEMRNICAIQYINIMCSAFFLRFFLLLLNNCKLDMLGQTQLSVLPAHHGQRENNSL